MTALGRAAAWYSSTTCAQRLAAMLGGEGDDRRRAAERRRHGAAVEIVGAHDPGRGALLDMAMAVDRRRAGRACRRRRSRAPRPARPRPRVATTPSLMPTSQCVGVGGGRHRAVADDEIVIAHWDVPRYRPTTPLHRSRARCRGEATPRRRVAAAELGPRVAQQPAWGWPASCRGLISPSACPFSGVSRGRRHGEHGTASHSTHLPSGERR